VHEGWIERAENTPEGGEFALRALLELPDRPTAVLAATDVLAIGVLHWASEAGLSIPTGLSVVGFDDIALAAYTVPPLTTLRMPTAEMIAEAVRIAMDEASLPEAERGPSLRVLRPALVVRGSTARPSADFSD
jgi:DNA-binding LacI/PurR family transcriptional regulator